jgi:hypothetical protein
MKYPASAAGAHFIESIVQKMLEAYFLHNALYFWCGGAA